MNRTYNVCILIKSQPQNQKLYIFFPKMSTENNPHLRYESFSDHANINATSHTHSSLTCS